MTRLAQSKVVTAMSSSASDEAGEHRSWSARLADLGWHIRLKPQPPQPPPRRPSASPAATPASHPDDRERAARMAVLAYRQASLSRHDLPCRAALRAYQQLRPDDPNAADQVIAAIARARRRHPAWF